jgi:hypothetical protein
MFRCNWPPSGAEVGKDPGGSSSYLARPTCTPDDGQLGRDL